MAERKITRPTTRPSNTGTKYPEDFSLFKETVKNIPGNLAEVGQAVARGTAGAFATPVAGYMSLAESVKQKKPTFVQPKFQPSKSTLSGAVFGKKDFTPLSEVTEFQDVFRGEEEKGKVTGFTPFLMGGFALADIPSGGLFSKSAKTIAKFTKSGKAANSASDAAKVLRAGRISDETINIFKLDQRLAKATDDTEVERIFREATQAESSLKKNGNTPIKRTVTRQPQPTARVSKTTTTNPVLPRVSRTETKTPGPQVRSLVDDVLPKGRVLDGTPAPKANTVSEALDSYIFYNDRRKLTPDVAEAVESFNIKPEEAVTLYREGDVDPTRIQSWTKNPEYFNNPVAQTFTPDQILVDTTDTRFRSIFPEQSQDALNKYNTLENEVIVKPTQTEGRNPDQVIEEGLNKYQAQEVVPVDGDTTLAKLATKVAKRGGTEMASDLLTPISSRLGRINPKLKFKLRNLEFATRKNTQENLEAVVPLLESTKKMTPADRTAFDLARKNGDEAVLDAIVQKYGIEDAYNDYRNVLDDIHKRATNVGIEVGYRGNYSPRMVKNPRDYVAYLRGRNDWGDLQKTIVDKAEQKGVAYTDLDDIEIAGIVNNSLRGYGNRVTLAASGNTKARSIDIIGPELNKFYESSDAALLAYIHKMNDEIEARKFFGKELIKGAGENARVVNPLTGQESAITAENSIGAFVGDLLAKGEITAKEQDEVTRILQSRFKKGEMNSFIAAYRDLEYISTMGNPISAMTQFGDLTFNVYKNGWYNTLRGIGTVITDKNRIKKETLGLERIAQEFDNPAKTSKALEKIFKWVGMEQVDRLGKESFLAASRSKLQTLAKKNDDALVSELNYMFDTPDAIRTLEELKANAVTERTKEVLFNRLLDIQPLAKSEMPVKYLEMPNGRIFYMLKSFTIKQFDIFRRESIDKIVSGTAKEKAQGMKNLVYLSGLFMLANASVDEMKDYVLGRETSLKDRTVDNVMRLFGATKFDVYKSRQEGIGTTVLRKILPPASLWDRLSTDATNLVEDKRYERGPLEGERYKSESVQSIPFGKLYYWWFGRGAQKEEFKAGGSSTGGSGKVRSISRPGSEEESNERVRTVNRP